MYDHVDIVRLPSRSLTIRSRIRKDKRRMYFQRENHLVCTSPSRPDDPDYDQSTLWLPRKPNGQLDEDKMKADPNCPIKKNKETGEVERDKKTKEPLRDTGKFVSPMLIQYWNIKAKNFDKIAL